MDVVSPRRQLLFDVSLLWLEIVAQSICLRSSAPLLVVPNFAAGLFR